MHVIWGDELFGDPLVGPGNEDEATIRCHTVLVTAARLRVV